MRNWINWVAKYRTGYHRCRQRDMLTTLRQCVIPFHWRHNHGWLVPAISIIRKCVFLFHEQHNHRWHVSATFYSQWVRNPMSRASPWSQLTCSRHCRLSGCAYLYSMSSTTMAEMFLPLFTLSRCVFLLHELNHHGLYDPAIFNYQKVRIYISWAAQSCLTCSCHFLLSGSEHLYFMSSSLILFAAPSWLTCSRHFRLSGSAYLFHEQHSHGWRVPVTFDSKLVRNPIPWAAPRSRLTCSCHFQLLASAYLYDMSSRIMADMFLPHLILRQCVIISISFATLSRLTCFRHFDFQEVFKFREQHDHIWHFPDIFFLALSRCVFPFHSCPHHG